MGSFTFVEDVSNANEYISKVLNSVVYLFLMLNFDIIGHPLLLSVNHALLEFNESSVTELSLWSPMIMTGQCERSVNAFVLIKGDGIQV